MQLLFQLCSKGKWGFNMTGNIDTLVLMIPRNTPFAFRLNQLLGIPAFYIVLKSRLFA